MMRPIRFVGTSKKELSTFPDDVKQDVGHALFEAQKGGRAPSAKTLQGFSGAGVVEIVEEHHGNAYRCVYTVRLKHAVYVLHAFQKKSKQGIATPKQDIELVRKRLREAEDIDRMNEESGR